MSSKIEESGRSMPCGNGDISNLHRNEIVAMVGVCRHDSLMKKESLGGAGMVSDVQNIFPKEGQS